MLNAGPTLQFIRRIRIGADLKAALAAYSHSWKVSRTQSEKHLSALADSIYFIAKGCPSLVALHFSPTNAVHTHPQAVVSVTKALQSLVEHCPDLLVLGVIVRVQKIYISTIESTMEITKWTCWQDCELELRSIAKYARADVVVTWSNTRVREAVEYRELLRFIPWQETFDLREPWEGDVWKSKR